jgi:hypothetical protein
MNARVSIYEDDWLKKTLLNHFHVSAYRTFTSVKAMFASNIFLRQIIVL